MTMIRFPLSGSKGLEEVSLYADYAECAQSNLNEGNYFGAVAVCSIGLDVLLNTLPDRILLFSSDRLSDSQKTTLKKVNNGTFTAGAVVGQLKKARILEPRLITKFEDLVEARNAAFHPFQNGSLKANAVYPSSASKPYAKSFFKKFCGVIDLCGGQSPLRPKRRLNSYIAERRNAQDKKRMGK
jgi:hypothetical protein